MRLQIAERFDGEPWDARVREFGGTIFHSSAWASYTMAGQPDVSPRFITLLSNEGDPVGIALGFQARSPRKVLAPLTGRLWFDTPQVVRGDDPERLAEFLRLLESYARKEGCVEMGVGSFAACDSDVGLEKQGFRTTKYWEFVLGLELSEDDLWNQFEYKRRKNIKKAMNGGVRIRPMPAEEGIAHLRRLQGESSQRIVERGGPDITYKGDPERDPVLSLIRSGLGRLVGAEADGEVVSAGLFTYFNGLVYHTLSGHSGKALQTQAPTLLLWETLKRYRAEGAVAFNFGGCSIDAVKEGSPEHGVYAYKKAFGGQCVERTSGVKILRPTAHKAVAFLKSLLRNRRQER